jgi:hypothetical protein
LVVWFLPYLLLESWSGQTATAIAAAAALQGQKDHGGTFNYSSSATCMIRFKQYNDCNQQLLNIAEVFLRK